MNKCETELTSGQIDLLRLIPFIDFAALALTEDEGKSYHWRYVSGNANQRYKRMVVKRGKGLPGMALILGKPLMKDPRTVNEGAFNIECSLMLAEGLQAAVAVPIQTLSENSGVLIVGSRQPYIYSAGDLKYIKDFAGELERLINK